MSWIIYKHTNKVNGKVYIGQTSKSNPNYRWNDGKGYTKRNPDSHFARAIAKYGWESFDHEILESGIPTLELANERESFWIKCFDSVENGYNANYGGDSRLPSKETKAKLSAKSKNMWANKGDELREIYSSREHREKLSKSIKNYYANNPNARTEISKKRRQMIWITNGIETRQINAKFFPNFKGDNGWTRGKTFISFDTLAFMLMDYQKPNDLSLKELSEKYGYSREVIERAFRMCNVSLINKGYKTKLANKGLKRSDETKQKMSLATSKYRKGRIWVNKDGVSKSILASEKEDYIANGWNDGRGHIDSTNMKKPQSMKKKIIRSDGIIFDSITEAAKEMGISKSGIQNVLKKRPHCKTAGGYHWQYLKE